MNSTGSSQLRLGLLSLALGGLVLAPLPGAAQGSTSVTVYNQNFALVKDVRELELERGVHRHRIDDVAASIDATSVHFKALDHPGAVAVLEQNYRYDLAGPDRLMSRYLNRDVQAVLEDGSVREGTLLSFDGAAVVLGTGNGGAVILNRESVRDVSLGEIPGGLVVKPTLIWTLASDRGGAERCEVSYLTDNLNWHAEYVAVVDQDDSALDLSGWVSVDNQSGATYENAKLKLVAGDVHRVEEPVRYEMMERAMKTQFDAAAPQFESREFFEYYIYTLERPATLTDRETKQLSLFPTAGTPVKKLLTYDGQANQSDVTVELEFQNREENGLGMPLPAGKMRVFKKDADDALEFVGEDRIDHTPKDEKVRVYLGNAFDVKGERKQTATRRISDRVREDSYEIELRNHKDETVEVIVVERQWGDWSVLDESHPHTKKDVSTLEFPVTLEPDATVTVTYTVRVRW
jgi:hypothetical protein